MPTEILMPRLTYEMREGRVASWLKREGELVQPGDGLFEVETDKANVVVEAESSGILRGVRFQTGETAPVGEVVAYILQPDEQVPFAGAVRGVQAEATVLPTREIPTPPQRNQPRASSSTDDRVRASPIAKRLAMEHGIDISQVRGTGPDGRVMEADLKREIEKRQTRSNSDEAPFRDVDLTRVQKSTGEKLSQSHRTVPQFVLESNVDMSSAIALRRRIEAGHGIRPSFTTIIGKAVAMALTEHPEVNSSLVEGKRRVFSRVNLGIAVAIQEGLIVPVIHRADELSIQEFDVRLDEIVKRATSGSLRPEDIADGTFTISNLGMFDIDAFQAIINPPQSAILAVGRVRDLVVARDGMIGVRPTTTMRLSIDHRVLDGAMAARFLGKLKAILENCADSGNF